MYKIRTKVTEKGPGIGKLVETLGGLGHLTLGVQGDEALAKHPESELTVGDIAAIWELGLAPNGPRRSWLASWIDANQDRMVKEAREVFQDILRGKMSRKRGFQKLGLQWATEIRQNLAAGNVRPGLRPSTIKIKGHAIPLIDTYALHNAIGYKIFLPHWKNVPGGSAGGAARVAMAKTLPAIGSEEKGSPQPPDKGGAYGPRRRGKFAGLDARQYALARRRNIKQKVGAIKGGGLHSLAYAKTAKMKVVGMRAPARVRKLKAKALRSVSKPKAQAAISSSRRVRKANWALKWIKKLARKVLTGQTRNDGRNHGYGGVSRFGATGRSGRRR